MRTNGCSTLSLPEEPRPRRSSLAFGALLWSIPTRRVSKGNSRDLRFPPNQSLVAIELHMHYINLVGWIAFSEVIMGSLVGLLKVVVISMLGWFVTGAVPAMGQPKDAIEVVVIIGREMDEPAIREILESCLVTDLEFVQGPELWEQLADPFPAVELQGEEE